MSNACVTTLQVLNTWYEYISNAQRVQNENSRLSYQPPAAPGTHSDTAADAQEAPPAKQRDSTILTKIDVSGFYLRKVR